MFSESSNPTELPRIIFHPSGSGKTKMAGIKLEVTISQLISVDDTDLRKVTEVLTLTPSGLEMAFKRSVWWYYCPHQITM